MTRTLTPLRISLFSGILMVSMLLLTVQLHGQNIARNEITGTNPNEDNPYTNGELVVPNLVFSGIGRSDGITGYNANNRYNANGWVTDELDAEKYFYFKITPEPGFHIEFVSFEYEGQRSAQGPTSVSFRSSLDGFTSDIGTPTITGSSIDLSDAAFQGIASEIEFRIYAWGATHPDGTFSINSFAFKGYVFDTDCLTPSVAGVITGPAEVNSWQKGVAYSVDAVNRAEGYMWNLPPGASIATGDHTRQITVDFEDFSGHIEVRGTNACGSGPVSPVLNVKVEYPVIYLHDFGTDDIVEHPYTVAPSVFADHLSNSVWTNTTGSWTLTAGVTVLPDKAITASNLEGTPSFNLNFNIDAGYELKITHFNFWRRRSDTGPNTWSMIINGINTGNGTSPTTGNFIVKRAVQFPINSLTGNVSMVLTLGGATNSAGTLRIDDFTLFGMVDCIAVAADAPDDVFVCGSYTLPPLSSGNYFTGSMRTGSPLFENDVITTSQTIYVYAENDDALECFDENSFEVTIYQLIRTNPIVRSGN
jgi:hypothetical protein